jgi:hypothetical protein
MLFVLDAEDFNELSQPVRSRTLSSLVFIQSTDGSKINRSLSRKKVLQGLFIILSFGPRHQDATFADLAYACAAEAISSEICFGSADVNRRKS